MPLFDYVNIKDKSDVIEILYRDNDVVSDVLKINGKTYKKMASMPQRVKFKGTGFHATDYK